jgi:hypothetical protein
MARLGMAVAIGLVVAVVGSGCASRGGDAGQPGPRRPGTGKAERVWTACPAATGSPAVADPAGAAALPLLGDDFHAVAAVLCQSAMQRRTDGGTDLVATESRADDVTALVAALRLPDQPPVTGFCTADLVGIPYLVLLDERGRWMRPGVPVDGCHKPRAEVRAAIAGLRLTPVSAKPIMQVKSAEAAAAGCEQRWSDMVWTTAAFGATRARTERAVLYDGTAPVRTCVYRVPADEQRTSKPGGDFVSGRTLTAAQWSGVRLRVAAAAPPAPCATPADRFALLLTGRGEIYLELDHCRRILAPAAGGHETLLRGSAALATLVAG